MAFSWHESGRKTLLAALTAACDQAETALLKEVEARDQKREERHRLELCEQKAGAEKIQRGLESEIQTLKDTIASLKETIVPTPQLQRGELHEDANNNGIYKLGSDYARADDKVGEGADAADPAELQRSLAKMRSRYNDLREQLDTALLVARKRKTETLSWVQYADSLERKIQKLKKKRAGALPTAVTPSGAVVISTPDTSPAPVSPSKPEGQQHLLPSTLDALPNGAAEDPSRPNLSASFASVSVSLQSLDNRRDKATSREEEEDEREEEVLPAISHDLDSTTSQPLPESTQGEPSSDAPLPGISVKDGARTQRSSHVSIKAEPLSDGPEVIFERYAKRQRQDDSISCPSPAYTGRLFVKHESSGSLGSRRSCLANSQESIDLDEGQLAIPTPRKRHLVYCDQPSPNEIDNLPANSVANGAAEEDSPVASTRDVATPGVLAPISTNVQHRLGSHTMRSKDPAKCARQLRRGVDSVAEEGSVVAPERREREQSRLWSTPASERLKSLLNSRPPEPSPVLPISKTVRASPANSPVSGAFGRPPPTRDLPRLRHTRGAPRPPEEFSTPVSSTANRQQEAKRTNNRLVTPVASSKKALRDKRADELKLDDFKINPVFNDGHAFAYNEVVRSRSDRLNLPGCTDPQCCGKAFRSMAQSELTAAGPSHVNRLESIIMMEQYLGDEAFVLARLSPEEKSNLWIEARTRQLADKYGKHRHRYHRRASPPGFWDADFPTTQEEEENRIESRRIEKEIIQERLREALRPGGRWLFRDE